MTATKGHFEQGRWVEDREPEPVPEAAPIEERITSATSAIAAAMDDIASVTRDLVTSDEGKQFIEKTVKESTDQVQKSIESLVARARSDLEKSLKSLK